MDTTGKEEVQQTRRNLAQNSGARAQESWPDPANSPRNHSKQTNVVLPCRRLKHLMAQRGRKLLTPAMFYGFVILSGFF